MKLFRIAAALLLILSCAGCTTPQISVKKKLVGTVQNEAVLVYAYVKEKPFRIQSDPVPVTIVAPQASQTSSQAVSETRQAATRASSKSSVVASSSEQTSVKEQHSQAMARSSSEDRSDASAEEWHSAAAAEITSANHSSISVADFASSIRTIAHRSSIQHATAQSSIGSTGARSSSKWTTQQPVIRKWATFESVIVGQRFEYVVEVLNNTGLDLAVVGVGDRLDPRLSVDPSAVRVSLYAEVDLTNRLLKVKFPQGIKRGDSARIVIPVFVTPDVDN